jgi:hypothetical protein
MTRLEIHTLYWAVIISMAVWGYAIRYRMDTAIHYLDGIERRLILLEVKR